MPEKIHPINEAIDEQLKSFAVENNLERRVMRRRLIREQIMCPRRPTETILVEMADKMKSWKPDQPAPKKKKRKRRRGPRVQVVTF